MKARSIASLEKEFKERADRWERESAIHSSPVVTYLYRDYLAIMGMGIMEPDAIVPLILKRIPETGADWFFALEKIAGQNPAEDCETFESAYTAWQEWAIRNGYINAMLAA